MFVIQYLLSFSPRFFVHHLLDFLPLDFPRKLYQYGLPFHYTEYITLLHNYQMASVFNLVSLLQHTTSALLPSERSFFTTICRSIRSFSPATWEMIPTSRRPSPNWLRACMPDGAGHGIGIALHPILRVEAAERERSASFTRKSSSRATASAEGTVLS